MNFSIFAMRRLHENTVRTMAVCFLDDFMTFIWNVLETIKAGSVRTIKM